MKYTNWIAALLLVIMYPSVPTFAEDDLLDVEAEMEDANKKLADLTRMALAVGQLRVVDCCRLLQTVATCVGVLVNFILHYFLPCF